MKLFRFLVPMGALLALLAFLPACDSDGGDTTPVTDTQEPPADTQQQCPAECGPCEECNEGTGFACQTTCETGEICQDGACVADTTTCDPACDAAMCMACNETTDTCESTCTEGQVCNAGTCETQTTTCEPACDATMCMACNEETDTCESTCTEGQECNAGTCEDIPACDPACGPCQDCVDGACVDQCDAADCETCVDNACVGCAEGFYCEAEQCVEANVACVNPNADGFCDASIVDELAIAPAPNATTGEEGCCCDFTDDGVYDNQLAALVTNLGGMAGFDLVTLNETVAESLAGGSFIILFEHVGLAAEGADTPYFDINFFLGADTDDPEDPTDNFSGTEEFTIMPESLDANGDPLITFQGASVEGGMLHAGPSQFVVPIQIPDPPLDLTLTVDSAIVDAAVAWNNGYQLNDGKLCGYVTIAQIFNALNQFAAGNCGCLNLTGDLIEGIDTGAFACGDTSDDPTCDPEDPVDGSVQEICGMIGQYCGTAVVLLPSFLDVDTDDDGTGDAISLGATFGATSAVLTSGGGM